MIYLSLGSNKGNRLDFLNKAIEALSVVGFKIYQKSVILETKAILSKDSSDDWDIPYLNMVICGSIDKSPLDFINIIQNIEISLGRDRDHKFWSPREIDIDILLWNDLNINTKVLTIPHKEIFTRPFLLLLLAMLNPYYRVLDKNNKYYGLNIAEIAYKMNIPSQDNFIKALSLEPKLIGIVNITPDSFSDGMVYYQVDDAINRIISMYNDGAYAIDIGAQSTRPKADLININTELDRLEPVLEKVQNYINKGVNIKISIDSFIPEVIEKLINKYSIAWVNDQKGDLNKELLQEIAKKGLKIVAMHNLSIPASSDILMNFNDNPINSIITWANLKIEYLTSLGFNNNQIIIDPGIGFGKSPIQNLQLLSCIKRLRDLQCKILIGHSRKSYINCFTNNAFKDRDIETLGVSSQIAQYCDYLRVHDVKLHQRFFTSKAAIINQ